MNRTIGIQLLVYSLALAGLSFLVHHLAPTLARPTLIAGPTGGGLCLVWALRALTGNRGKALPLLTLVPVSFVLLSQAVLTWVRGGPPVPGQQFAAAVITLQLVLSVAMLMRIAYAGVVLDGVQAKPAKAGATQGKTAGKATAQANVVRRA